jgi:branched-chain amino acid transport system permease protein
MTIISPESFSFWESVQLFLMVILGGSGSIPGVIVGAAIVVLMPEVFRDLASARMLLFGLVMMVMMVIRPQGLLPVRGLRFRRADLRKAEAEKAAAQKAGLAPEAAR